MSGVEPIAIIGIGCRFPGGVRSGEDLWRLLVDGTDAVVEIPEERWHLPAISHPDLTKPGKMVTRCAGLLDQVDQFDAQFFGISPREAARLDPQQRLLLETAYHAVEDAGLTKTQQAPFVGFADPSVTNTVVGNALGNRIVRFGLTFRF